MEPVEIDIRMRQNVSEESEKAARGVSGIGAASEKAMQDLDAQIKRQLAAIQQISRALDDLEKKSSGKGKGVDSSDVDVTKERIASLRTMLDDARARMLEMKADAEALNKIIASTVEQFARLNQGGKSNGLSNEQRLVVDALEQTVSEATLADKSIANIGLTSKESFEQIKRTVKEQSDVVKNLKADLQAAEKAYEDMMPGDKKNAAYAEMEGIRKQYAGAVVDLDKLRIKKEELTVSSRTLTVQMEYLRDRMAKLRFEGRSNTEEYADLEALYKKLAATYDTVRFEGKEDSGVQGMVQGVSGLAGVLTAGTGVMSLFNGKSEEMEKIQARLQGMIAITIGLQEAHNLVNKQGAFWAMYVTKAQNLFAVANLRLATTMGISTAAAKALTATMTLGLSIAITAIITLISKYASKSAEAARQTREMQEQAAGSASKTIVSYQQLQTAWKALGSDMGAKNRFIAERADDFKQLGVNITSIGDAETLFVGGEQAFIDSVMRRAMAAAMMDVAADKYKKALEKMFAAEKLPDTVTKVTVAGPYVSSSQRVANPEKKRLMADAKTELEKSQKEVKNFITTAIKETESANKMLEDAGIKTAGKVAVGTKAYWEQMQKNYLATLSSMTDADVGTAQWKAAEQGYRQAAKKVALFDIKGNDRDDKSKAAKIKAAGDALEKMSLDYDAKIEAARAAAIKKGRANMLADAKADFDRQKTQLSKDIIEIEKLEKITGQPATEQRDKNKELSDKAAAQYNSKVDQINEAADRALTEIMSSVSQNLQGELDANLASIDTYYNDILQKAIEEGASEEQLQRIRLARTIETERARRDERMRTVDFEAEVARLTIEYADKAYVFAADRQMALVAVQQEATTKRLSLLKDQYKDTPTPELARDIRLAELALEGFSQTLSDLQTSKLQEIEALSQSIAKLGSSLSKSGGALGEYGNYLEGLTSGMGDLMTVLDKSSTGVDQIGAAINGLATLYGMIADQIASNKQAQEEWTAAIESSAQAARMARIEQSAYAPHNMFGVENPYSEAVASMNTYMTAMKELKDYSSVMGGGKVQVDTAQGLSGKNIATGLSAGAATGAAIGTIFAGFTLGLSTVIGAGIGAIVGGIAGAVSTKTKPVFASLKEQYGQIYDTETYELNPAILADYDKLDKATKEMVDNWDEIKDSAKEAQEEMEKSLSDLAGNLGDQLSSSLVESFRNGDIWDAVDDFHSKVTSTIEDIISQIIFAASFGDLFDDLGERFKNSFNEGGDGSIIDDLMWFDKNYRGRIDAYDKAMKEAQAAGKELGYDFFSLSQRSGTAGALASASQESISELSGGVLAMRTALADIRNMHREELTILRAAMGHLARIEENTEYCRYLESVDNTLSGLLSRFDRGLKMIV